MKCNIILLIFLTVFFHQSVFAQNADDNFAGLWKTQEGHQIEITKVENRFIGKLKSKGLLILEDLKFEQGKWIGKINNPKKQITAACEAFLEKKQIRFIASKGFYSKTIYWTKVN